MKKIIVSQETPEINQHIEDLKNYQKSFDNVYLKLKETKIPIKLNSIYELVDLTNNTERVIKDKLAEQIKEPPTILGMKIGRAKAVDLIDLPDLTELNEAIAIHKNLFASNEPKLINGLTINNDVVEIKPNYLQHIEDIYSIYAESQKEIEVFEAHKELVNCINTIKKIFPLNGLTTLDELCMFDVKDNKATIRTYYWKKNFRHILSEREPKG
jgi:hypothetical protein